MFLRHRKAAQNAFCLLFALLLSFGMHTWGGSFGYSDESFETTSVPETTIAGIEETVGGTTVPTTTEAEAIPDLEEIPTRSQILLRRLLAITLMAGSLVFLGLAVAYAQQEKPYLGPEIESLLLILLLFLAWQATVLESTVLLCILLLPAAALLCCLTAWAKHRFSPDWLMLHRLAMTSGGKETPYRVYPAFLVGATGLFALLFYALNRYHVYFVRYNYGYRTGLPVYPLYAWLVGCTVCAIFLLLRYQKSNNDLLARVHHPDRSPTDTLFRPEQELLLAQQQEKQNAIAQAVADERFKVELISNVSHDLRTPLTAILGYGELLEKENLSPEGAEQLQKLNRKSRYMRDLVDSLFELTKVSSGTVEAKIDRIDLIRLLEQTIGLAEDALQDAGLVVKRKYCENAISLATDGARMHQVFMNLLENAMKYALKGSRIYLNVLDAEESYEISLVNTASYEMDFTPEEIVERFARGDKARSTQGSGIGLAIASTYTESVGGSFRVEIDGDQFRAIVRLPKN